VTARKLPAATAGKASAKSAREASSAATGKARAKINNQIERTAATKTAATKMPATKTAATKTGRAGRATGSRPEPKWAALEHFPAKWIPVRRQKMRPFKEK
jgi:hypothetical protein